MRYQRAELPLKLDGLKAARAFFAECFEDGDSTRESLWVAHVDEGARCLHLARYPGDESGGAFPLREIIIDASEHGSAGIVIAHNHPSATRARASRTAARRAASRPPPKRSTAQSSITWCLQVRSAPASERSDCFRIRRP